jgi:hypothetical protein
MASRRRDLNEAGAVAVSSARFNSMQEPPFFKKSAGTQVTVWPNIS